MLTFQKFISRCLIVMMLIWQVPMAQAGIVATESAIHTQQQEWTRSNLSVLLEQENVRTQLSALGIDQATAQNRVAHMTDQEVSILNQKLADQPAGGSVLGVILVVFIVFVITDSLGATDVFSFVHDINH